MNCLDTIAFDSCKFVFSGNRLIHAISTSEPHELRIHVSSFAGKHAYAIYRTFSVGPECDNFVLHVEDYEGTAGE